MVVVSNNQSSRQKSCSVEPPVYGNYFRYKTSCCPKRNDKPLHHNTPRSDRSRISGKLEQLSPFPSRQEFMMFPFSGGNKECSSGGKAPSLRSTRSRKFGVQPQMPKTVKQDSCETPCFPEFIPIWEAKSNSNKKHYWNIMYDPRIFRGSTVVPFPIAQKAKCQRWTEINTTMLIRLQNKLRLKRIKENPEWIPRVQVPKDPLTYQAFLPFLTEEKEPETCKDATQEGRLDVIDLPTKNIEGGFSQVLAGAPYSHSKKKVKSTGQTKPLCGIPVRVQTDPDPHPFGMDLKAYLVSTMRDKIIEQAALEVVYDYELAPLQGLRQQAEMELMYRKWQKMKEAQWKEWLYAWNEVRMLDIIADDEYLQDMQERLCVIAFAKNVRKRCMRNTSEELKRDGYVNQYGIPFEDLNKMDDDVNFTKSIKRAYNGKSLLARRVVDSLLASATLPRFAERMHASFGRPYGRWLDRPGRHDSIEYDIDLEWYIEGRWKARRSEKFGPGQIGLSLIKEGEEYPKSLLDFDINAVPNQKGKGRHATPTHAPKRSVSVQRILAPKKLNPLASRGKSVEFSKIVSVTEFEKDGPMQGNSRVVKNPPQRAVVSIPQLEKEDVSRESSRFRIEPSEEEVSILYQRKTRWSTLENRERENI